MRISDWSSDVCSSDLLVKKARDRAELGLVIAIFRRWTEFDFLDLDLLLLFLRSVRGLVLLIKVLAVIHDLADRRFRVWRNLNQIETFFFSLGLGITRQHDPELLTIVRDYADPRRGDLIVAPIFTFKSDCVIS